MFFSGWVVSRAYSKGLSRSIHPVRTSAGVCLHNGGTSAEPPNCRRGPGHGSDQAGTPKYRFLPLRGPKRALQALKRRWGRPGPRGALKGPHRPFLLKHRAHRRPHRPNTGHNRRWPSRCGILRVRVSSTANSRRTAQNQQPSLEKHNPAGRPHRPVAPCGNPFRRSQLPKTPKPAVWNRVKHPPLGVPFWCGTPRQDIPQGALALPNISNAAVACTPTEPTPDVHSRCWRRTVDGVEEPPPGRPPAASCGWCRRPIFRPTAGTTAGPRPSCGPDRCNRGPEETLPGVEARPFPPWACPVGGRSAPGRR